MTARAIVSDPDIMYGRWRFEGTSIPVAVIRTDVQASNAELIEQYKRAGLTDEDLAAAEAFEFPPVRETEVSVELASISIHCECGEDTYKTVLGLTDSTVHCVCRRNWRVTIAPILDDETD